MEDLFSTNFMVIDCEGIYVDTHHTCIRQLYMLTNNWDTYEGAFQPCFGFYSLSRKASQSFDYCKKFIHKLDYYPTEKSSLSCSHVDGVVRDFVLHYKVTQILHKGGTIKKGLASRIGVPSFDIELLGAPKIHHCHDPKEEVLEHYNWFHNYCI